MAFMLVRSKVRDFKTWKPAYDAHLAARDDAGRAVSTILRQPGSAIYCSNSAVRVSAVD